MTDAELMAEALVEARRSLAQGGLPIGAVLADAAGKIVARGHNLRVQEGDPTAHGETVCLRNAGRRRDWSALTMATTLSPCVMCTGTILLYRIPRVIVGENESFLGEEELLRSRGVEVVVLDDADCRALMAGFIAGSPDLWDEDIGR